MAIEHSYLPDISIVSSVEGNEIMIVEVKNDFPKNSQTEAMQVLKNYMKRFYTKLGLIVTPDQTLVMSKAYLKSVEGVEDGYFSKLLRSEQIFGSAINSLQSEELENYVYYRMVDMINSINNYNAPDYAKELSPDIEYWLEITQVVKRRA